MRRQKARSDLLREILEAQPVFKKPHEVLNRVSDGGCADHYNIC